MDINRRVLLVDDDADVLATYQEVLQGRPQRRRAADTETQFELSVASSGEEAIRIVQQQLKLGRNFTCGVFDMRMPGLDGFETIREIRKLDSNVLCAVCTAYSDRSIDEIDDLFEAHEKDQWDYLQKPVSAAELLQKVRCLVSGWNLRRRAKLHRERLAMLIAQLSKLTSTRPGDVEDTIDLMMEAVRGLTSASRGALLEGPENSRKILRSWSEMGDEKWAEELLATDLSYRASNRLVFFDLPDDDLPPFLGLKDNHDLSALKLNGDPKIPPAKSAHPQPPRTSNTRSRTLVLSSPESSDRSLIDALGLLLDNARRLLNLNEKLKTSNDSLGRQIEALASARSQTIQSAKLAAVGKISSSISTEISPLLSVIQLEAEAILDVNQTSNSVEPEIQRSTLKIQQEAQRIKNVVCQIRDLALRSPEYRTPISLSELVNEAINSFGSEFDIIDLASNIPDDLPPLNGNRTQITQVIVNILSNAIDAQADIKEKSVTIQGFISHSNSEMLRIEIRDSGRGMDLKTCNQAVDPFFSTKPTHEFSGLGLTVAQSIVELHNGVLNINSAPNQGTTVSIELPVYKESGRGLTITSVQPRVLVLRANTFRATRAAEALKYAKAIPVIAGSRTDAFTQLKRNMAHVIMTDVETDEGPIWTLLEELRHHFGSPPPVLVFSRGHQTIETDELSDIGVAGQVSEPFDISTLSHLILKTMTGTQTEDSDYITRPAAQSSQ